MSQIPKSSRSGVLALLALHLLLFSILQAQDVTYIRQHYRKQEARIPMRDGVRLFTSIYIPVDSSTSYPIILVRTPYGVGPYGADAFRENMLPSMLEAREGFVFAYQDVRGTYLSDGEFVDVRPHLPPDHSPGETDESSDTYDTVEWLTRSIPRNNGKVGITGISYPGYYATMGLLSAHPATVAVSPQAPIADWFIGDDVHHNGALFLSEAFNFFIAFGRQRPTPTTVNPFDFKQNIGDDFRFFLEIGPLQNINRFYMRDSIRFWNDIVNHGTYDEFWQARNVLPHLTNIKPAAMVVGGWFDKEDLYGTLATYREIERHNPEASTMLVVGPWAHGGWAWGDGERLGTIYFGGKTAVWFREKVQLPFFVSLLKGRGPLRPSKVTVFETGSNEWKFLNSWPPAEAKPLTLFLRQGGGLSFQPPNLNDTPYTHFTSDPGKPAPFTSAPNSHVHPEYMVEDQRFAAQRPDVLVYQTPPLTKDLTFAGPLTACLYVATSGSDADWVVKIIDVSPPQRGEGPHPSIPAGGYQMLVRGDVFRGKFRNSFSIPEAFVPYQITKVQFTLQDIFHRFKAGHRIMVQIQSSWFPLVDRNPQTFVDIYHASLDDFQVAEHRVYHSVQYSTHVDGLVREDE